METTVEVEVSHVNSVKLTNYYLRLYLYLTSKRFTLYLTLSNFHVSYRFHPVQLVLFLQIRLMRRLWIISWM